MSTHMPPGSLNLESQLFSIMDVLVKAAVTEISQLFSESSSSLRLHLTQSLKENEALRMRMKVMRSELFSLRLQTRTNRPASRFSPARGNIFKTRAKPHVVINPPVAQKTVGEAASISLQPESQTSSSANQCSDVEPPDVILIKDEEDIGGCGQVVVVLEPPVAQKTVGEAASISHPSESKTSSSTARAKCADVETPDVIQIKDEDDVGGCGSVGRDDFESQVTRGEVDSGTPLSCLTGNHEELRIVSVHGRGEGPLQETSDALFTASELQAFSSLSPDHNVTHDSLLNFTTGASDKSMMRGIQDNSVGLARNSQLERHQSTQVASAALNRAIKKAVMGADGHLVHSSNVSQFPQQQNVFPHAASKSLDCSFCGERFLSREDLIVHRATHTGESPVPCSFCGKSFVNKTTLTIHMRIHTGEKPYACDQCGKRFTQNGSLKIHLRTHSGEKPYTCNQCTASFNNPSNLRRHMITHNT